MLRIDTVCHSYRVFCFFSSRIRHTRCYRDWSSDVCSSDLSSLLRDARVAARGTGACERDAAVLTALCVLGRFAPDHLASGVTGDPTTGPQGRGGGAGGWQVGDAVSRVTADAPG